MAPVTRWSAMLALALIACGGNDAAPAATATAPGAAGVANPASVHCREHGGVLELMDGPAGVTGVCVFADDSRCEEWSFMRGECAPGSCREPDGRCGAAP